MVSFLSGCLSVSNSPQSRFYTLHAIFREKVDRKFDIPSGLIIGVGPIKIPEFLNRPQMVTQNESRLDFAEFDRWGEPLTQAIARIINENLKSMLPDATIETFPWNVFITVKYQVILDFIQIESRLDKDVFFVVQWSLLNLDTKEMMLTKRLTLRQPINGHSYAGLSEALSIAVGSLSRDIAEAVAQAESRPGSATNKTVSE